MQLNKKKINNSSSNVCNRSGIDRIDAIDLNLDSTNERKTHYEKVSMGHHIGIRSRLACRRFCKFHNSYEYI